MLDEMVAVEDEVVVGGTDGAVVVDNVELLELVVVFDVEVVDVLDVLDVDVVMELVVVVVEVGE